MYIPNLTPGDARVLSEKAQFYAFRKAPKLSGISSKNISPVSGPNFFGLKWREEYVWYQNAGSQPFTMNTQGKTIPMWIDPTEEQRKNNPKAETRTMAAGRQQILIFRKAKRNWLHPGLAPKEFLEFGMKQACRDWRLEPTEIKMDFSIENSGLSLVNRMKVMS